MSFDGKYTIIMQTPMGEQQGGLELTQNGEELTGSMEQDGEAEAIKNGKVEGDVASWEVDIPRPMPMTLTFQGKKDGSDITGAVTLGSFCESTFEAKAV